MAGKQGAEPINSAGIQFQALTHESEKLIPTRELQITQQGIDVLEEFLASAQSLADQMVFLIHQIENGMKEKR